MVSGQQYEFCKVYSHEMKIEAEKIYNRVHRKYGMSFRCACKYVMSLRRLKRTSSVLCLYPSVVLQRGQLYLVSHRRYTAGAKFLSPSFRLVKFRILIISLAEVWWILFCSKCERSGSFPLCFFFL
jgi:hypothetical protein